MNQGKKMDRTNSHEATIAGLYIRDDYIDVAIGTTDLRNASNGKSLFDVSVDKHKAFLFRDFKASNDFDEIEMAFDAVAHWIAKRGRSIGKVGIGCCGPFKTLDDRIPVSQRVALGYGEISSSVHSRLQRRNVYGLMTKALERHGYGGIDARVQTDVEVSALGELYNRHFQNGDWVEDGD